METALLIAQTTVTASLAGWLTLGVRDNISHPSINETYTAEVLSMARMQIEYPEIYAQVSTRAITDRFWQKLAFRAVVVLESIAAVALWVGTVALLMAMAGTAAEQTARTLAMLGTTGFVLIWALMLGVGNYFCYWLCHDGAQNTHYQMTLWGVGALILLAQSG